MPELHDTVMGKRLIEGTLPEIANQLKKLAESKNYGKSEWIGKEVQIYPGDTYEKFGKIVGMNDAGVTFLITQARDGDREWIEGKDKFVSYSAKLSFIEI